MRGRHARRGFSLMELILATAVLAASGAALFALIGQGSLFAGRADRETMALHLALSVLDEYLAMPGTVDTQGTFAEDARWAYQIRQEPLGDRDAGGLVRLVVEVMAADRADQAGTAAGTGDRQADVRLIRWVRGSSLDVLDDGELKGGAR